MENDKDKESIVHKTAIGRQLLHEAIEQKVEKEVIVLLLQAGAERSQKMKKDGKKETRSIRTKFKEMVGFLISFKSILSIFCSCKVFALSLSLPLS